MLTPSELGYFCVGFIFYLGAVIHVSFYICIDLSLYYILRVLSLIGQLAFTDAGNTSCIKVVRTEGEGVAQCGQGREFQRVGTSPTCSMYGI